MTRGRKTAVFSVVGLFLLLAAVGYCFRGHQGGDSSIQKKSAVPPGILTGVTYSHTSGMVARADFAITLSPEAILETSYYPALDPDTAEDEDWYHPSTKENVPITVAQWSDVEQIILELYPLMEPIPENRREVKLPPGIEVMDGGDSTSLILTWSTEDGTRSIRYDPPNDRRIHTLIALLEELADPIGREIPRYAPPELSGFYMGQSGALFSKDYSFQFDRGPSVVYGEDAPYILRPDLPRPVGSRRSGVTGSYQMRSGMPSPRLRRRSVWKNSRMAARKSRPAPSITLTANSSRRNWIRKQRSSSGRILQSWPCACWMNSHSTQIDP